MDSLKSWPEPVVPVQSILAGGCTTIPSQYVRPPSQRPSLSASRSACIEIPVIDLQAGAVDGGGVSAAAVSKACREWGFFQVVNHGVSPELVARVRAVWREFFDLPMGEKRAYANDPRTYEGYGSRMGVEKGAVLDWVDYFFLTVFPESRRDLGKWPSPPSSFRETIEEYGKRLLELCHDLLRVMSVSLGLDAGRLLEAIGGDEMGQTMRANFYSRCPQPDLTLGLSPHSDPGVLTFLLVDDHVKGLQVRRGDDWVTVDPVPGAFIVNVGDQIQILSNDIYKSVEHRVVVNSSEERLSLACFMNPKSTIPIGPCPELVAAATPSLYRPMPYDEYRLRLRMQGLRGKDLKSSSSS